MWYGTDAGRTDGRMEWNQYTPQQLRCAEGVIKTSSVAYNFSPTVTKCTTEQALAYDTKFRNCSSKTVNRRLISSGSFIQGWRWSHLTHWGRVMHICIRKLNIIGSDNGLLPDHCQAIIWTNVEILLIGPLGTNFSEILIEIHTFSFKKMHLKMSSEKLQPFCLGLNVLFEVEPVALPGPDAHTLTLSPAQSHKLTLSTAQPSYLASTSVDTRPGTIFRISQPNSTNSFSMATSNCLSALKSKNQKLFIWWLIQIIFIHKIVCCVLCKQLY